MAQVRRTLLQDLRKNSAFRALVLGLFTRRLLRRRAGRRIDVECHPGMPNHKEVIWKVALLSGFRLLPPSGALGTDRGSRALLYWGGQTGVERTADHWPRPDWAHAINADVRDTGKRHVARVFAQTFGYNLAVDPTSYVGPCVAKSNANSAHDGRLVSCPITDADPRMAYEVLVDNRAGAAEVLDLRVPVVGNELPFVYLKRRSIDSRFANRNSSVGVGETDEWLSPIEQTRIKTFCRAMALDLGELDILRDAGTGCIFIVDVNSMPFGPPRPIAFRDSVRAVDLYAAAVRRLIERWGESDWERAKDH